MPLDFLILKGQVQNWSPLGRPPGPLSSPKAELTVLSYTPLWLSLCRTPIHTGLVGTFASPHPDTVRLNYTYWMKEGRMTSSSFAHPWAHGKKFWRAGVHLLQETAWESCRVSCENTSLPAFFSSTASCVAEMSALLLTFFCELNYFFWVIKSCLIWLIPYLFNNRFHAGSQVQELGGRVAISLIEISLAPVILVRACSRKQAQIENLDSSGRCYSGGDKHINNYMKQKAVGAEQRDKHTVKTETVNNTWWINRNQQSVENRGDSRDTSYSYNDHLCVSLRGSPNCDYDIWLLSDIS